MILDKCGGGEADYVEEELYSEYREKATHKMKKEDDVSDHRSCN